MLSVDIIADISLWRSGRNRPELILHWWFWLATRPRMIGLRISTGLPILPMLVTRRCRGWGSTLRGLAGRRRDTGGEFTGPAGRLPFMPLAGPNLPVDMAWTDRLAHEQTDNSEFATSVRRMTGTSIGASALPLQLLRTGQSGIGHSRTLQRAVCNGWTGQGRRDRVETVVQTRSMVLSQQPHGPLWPITASAPISRGSPA